jgi:F0F1-type ATP synthase assembly protein I
MMRDNQRKWIRRAGLANSIGMTLIVSTIIGFGIGWLLDNHFHTAPILLLIIGLLGVAAGFIEMFRIVAQINKEEENDRR